MKPLVVPLIGPLIIAFASLCVASASQKSVVRAEESSEPPAGFAGIPTKAVFAPPPPNACHSKYDEFYIAEPGVYAYWALCEMGSDQSIFDYAGRFDLSPISHAWSSGPGTIRAGAPGPLPDGETGHQVMTGSSFIANQNIPLNTNQGTVALWANTDSTTNPAVMVFLGAVKGRSGISVSAMTGPNSECFVGTFTNSSGSSFATPQACGVSANAWHRLAFTWLDGAMALYIDGNSVSRSRYLGSLEDKVFVYRLFPESGDTRKQMTLAKVSIANQAWGAVQIMADYKPSLIFPPKGGVYVTAQRLGVIHRDVLGYADYNSDLTSASLISALTSGLSSIGVSAIRYANGYGGISADLENWRGGALCTATRSTTTPPTNVSTQNNLDNFVAKVSRPLGTSLGFTVNYGTNPPDCNSGGDPVANGSDLVAYTNLQKHYGIKYWEIGNELYNGGGSETDFHAKPGDGASYGTYEAGFYDAMKKKDTTILIGIPVADGVYSWLANWTLPAMRAAKYDAVVYHNYPVRDPVADGSTLYPERVASTVGRTRGSLLALQTELLNVKKDPEAIWITEWNADVGGNLWSRQSMGAAMPMFATMQLAEYMQAGVRYATWWTQGMSNVCMRYNYDPNGETSYNWWGCGGLFLIYTGALAPETAVGLKVGGVTPVARAFQLLSQSGFVTEGEHMLRVISDVQDAPWLAAFAATHGSSYALILVNRDRDQAHSVPVSLPGKVPRRAVRQWTYGRAQYDLSRYGDWSAAPIVSVLGASTNGFQATLPPWSVNVFICGE
jgi:hypothetical protein